MSDTPDHAARAREQAVERVRARLRGVDPAKAASRAGFDVAPDGVEAVFLGRRLRVRFGTLAVEAEDGRPVSNVEEMLVLRRLEAEREYRPTGEECPFRDLPGGAFYHAALARRTTDLLVKTIGNDLDRLHLALNRFPHETLDVGDASARIHAIGRIHVALIYRLGDEEFPPAADLLFDRAITTIYTLDETAALATSACLALVRQV